MNAVMHGSSPYDVSPESAIESIAAHSGPVYVDLDETLYLRNSTEDFIDLARPALLAVLVLRVLDVLKPWTWTGGEVTRDTWRVRVIWTLFPWTLVRWRLHVTRLAEEFSNRELARALQQRGGKLVVLTLGFQPIVEPLVRALGFPEALIVAARLSSFEDRRRGKLHFARHKLGDESIGSSLFVTDSLDDMLLLAQCARPLRTIWPGARFHRALSKVYLPGEYITQVKRPGERYLWRAVLQEDFAFWVLSSVALAAHPVTHVLGLAALLVSFWAIYERGYVDNDWVAEHLESDGKLTDAYWQAPVATPRIQPWIWAVASAAAAVYLLDWPGEARPLELAKWLAVLAATYAAFKVYNRINKTSRIWLFAVLQFARGAAFLVLVPITAVGAAGIAAVVLARWVPYYIYRLNSGTWPKLQANLMRLLFFVVITALLAAAQGPRSVLGWTTFALLGWNAFRARGELTAMLAGIQRVDRDTSSASP